MVSLSPTHVCFFLTAGAVPTLRVRATAGPEGEKGFVASCPGPGPETQNGEGDNLMVFYGACLSPRMSGRFSPPPLPTNGTVQSNIKNSCSILQEHVTWRNFSYIKGIIQHFGTFTRYVNSSTY